MDGLRRAYPQLASRKKAPLALAGVAHSLLFLSSWLSRCLGCRVRRLPAGWRRRGSREVEGLVVCMPSRHGARAPSPRIRILPSRPGGWLTGRLFPWAAFAGEARKGKGVRSESEGGGRAAHEAEAGCPFHNLQLARGRLPPPRASRLPSPPCLSRTAPSSACRVSVPSYRALRRARACPSVRGAGVLEAKSVAAGMSG